MNELVRWDPFRPFEEAVLGRMPTLMDAVFRQPGFSGPRTDIAETDDAYRLAIELPGASRDQVDVSVYGSTVTVSAEIAGDAQSEQEGWLLRERSFGKVQRSITLPEELDDAGCEAKLADGVLSLTLKKKRASQARRLTIH